MDSNIIDANLREEFKRDFLDQLQEIERIMLLLEKEPDNKEHVRNVFRPFHTIKGNSGLIGEMEIQDISQLSENILDDVRNGKKDLSESMIGAIFKSVDLIRAITERGDAEPFSESIREHKELLKTTELEKSKTSEKFLNYRRVILEKDQSKNILIKLVLLRRLINNCKYKRDFEPHLFDIFECVIDLSADFEKIISMPQISSALRYLESYLTILNNTEIKYSKTSWHLLKQIQSDITKAMYSALINSLDVGICYFNVSDTISDLNKTIDWIVSLGKSAVIVNINKINPPEIEEIYSLIDLKNKAKIPVVFTQRFFGHKQHWRDISLLLDDELKIEISLWNALESLVK